jgi:hypothetical protein
MTCMTNVKFPFLLRVTGHTLGRIERNGTVRYQTEHVPTDRSRHGVLLRDNSINLR